jgi:ABC-type branched-chain amino acid transport systems, ATPase component
MALLEAVDVSVRFGALRAVRDVSLSVNAAQIAALIGPNGAGKTTLFNAITGVQPYVGKVILDGVDVSEASPQKRARLGMNRTFQRLEVFGTMTAYDNIRTAAEIAARARRSSMRGCAARADEVVTMLGLTSVAPRRADSLPTGQARLVELGRVLATAPKVVLLDEPASGLDEHETDRMAEVLVALRDNGMAILLVEHDIDLVMRLSSVVHVLDLGNLIAVGTPEEVRDDARVREAYLGAA